MELTPSGLEIYPGPRVTSTFDLLIPKVEHFMQFPCGPLVPIGLKMGSFIFEISCTQFW